MMHASSCLRASVPSCLHHRHAMSMIEVLISISLSAMLLTAVASGFSASASAIDNNDQFFRATQAARVSLNQIITELRRCQTADVAQTPQPRINVWTYDNTDRSYVYDSTTQRLLLVNNEDPTHAQYVLAEQVTSAHFNAIMGSTTDGQGHTTTYVAQLSIDLLIQVGNNQLHLTGSVAPRAVHAFN